MKFFAPLAASMALALALSGSASAYKNNCKGSFLDPGLENCRNAINNIVADTLYEDGMEFSVRDCYIVYATNNSGKQPLKGSTIKTIASNIVDSCRGHKGSFGTGNCDQCHVTVNYRSPKKQ